MKLYRRTLPGAEPRLRRGRIRIAPALPFAMPMREYLRGRTCAATLERSIRRVSRRYAVDAYAVALDYNVDAGYVLRRLAIRFNDTNRRTTAASPLRDLFEEPEP